MSAVTRQAEAEFGIAMRDPHDLIWLHRDSQTGQGRRHRQPAMNRATVVLTVAAWQAFVQDLTTAILSHLAVPHGQQGHLLYKNVEATVRSGIRRYNTANAKNSVDLLLDVGFVVEPSWIFAIGTPPRSYKTANVRQEIDGWLEVRHKIAHGAPLPASALVSGRPAAGPSLHRGDAERCIAFFEKVVEVTSAAVDSAYP